LRKREKIETVGTIANGTRSVSRCDGRRDLKGFRKRRFHARHDVLETDYSCEAIKVVHIIENKEIREFLLEEVVAFT
jgi:hypothetical protein